jgi:hypothetical protein
MLLGLTKHFELPTAQIPELGKMIVQRGNPPDARPVARQLKLHFHYGHPLVEVLLQLI